MLALRAGGGGLGGWEGDQILKYKFSPTVIKEENSGNIFIITYEETMLLQFFSFISVKYVKKNTTTLSCAITGKKLWLNLLVTYQIFLRAEIFSKNFSCIIHSVTQL